MRNIFSVLVLATSFAVLVPDNRAQAVRAADLVTLPAAVATQSLAAAPAVSDAPAFNSGSQVPPQMSWLLALGFLGVVVARRLRPD